MIGFCTVAVLQHTALTLAPHVRYGGSDKAVFSLQMECGGWFKPQHHIVIVSVQSGSSVRSHAQVGLVL